MMSFLVQYKLNASQNTYSETAIEQDKLVVSSGAEGDIILPNVSAPFTIAGEKGGAVRVKELAKNTLFVGEKTVAAQSITQDNSVSVNGYIITVIAPPVGFDHALNLNVDKTFKQQALSQRQQKSPSIRWFSYSLFIITLLVCLVLPITSFMTQQDSAPEWAALIPDKLPISDAFFSSGPLVSAHQIPSIGDKCITCHQTPFEMVPDQSCTQCHTNSGGHIPLSNDESGMSGFNHLANLRCADCHREHNQPVSLVQSNNALCVDCHQQAFEKNDLGAVVAFSKQGHPNFGIDLLVLGGANNLTWTKQHQTWHQASSRDGGLVEQSNLKFSHEMHMNPDKVLHQTTSQSLACADCHQLSSDNEHFTPITMDNACRDCHALSFDSFEPDIELPHGNTYSAIVAMQAHFIRQFSDPNLRALRAQKKARRVPNKRQSLATCEKSALACGQEESVKELNFQFQQAGCVTCHVVNKTQTTSIFDQYTVMPVKLNNDWYRSAKFNHRTHFVNASVSDQHIAGSNNMCLDCHDVMHSSKASDILMPNKPLCLTCHDQTLEFSAQLQCIDCHSFHIDGISYPHENAVAAKEINDE